MSKTVKNVLVIIALLIVIALIGVVGFGYYQKATVQVQNPVATIVIKDFGTIQVELYPQYAPNTVANFVKLANNGFYDGLTFHRTIPEFMIQGGDPNGNGTGSPKLSDLDSSKEEKAYTIKGEFIANNYHQNKLKHEAGILSMARSDYSSLSSALTTQGYNSAGSQFFITTEKANNLDGIYTAFGKVTEGMDVVTAIGNVEVVTRDSSAEEGIDMPVDPPVIESIRVETYGVDYGMPETEEPFDYTSWLMQQYGQGSTGSSTVE